MRLEPCPEYLKSMELDSMTGVAKAVTVPIARIVLGEEAIVLIKDAIEHNRRAYVLVNNRLEGNAPLTQCKLSQTWSGRNVRGRAGGFRTESEGNLPIPYKN